jgi:hypothetical protein
LRQEFKIPKIYVQLGFFLRKYGPLELFGESPHYSVYYRIILYPTGGTETSGGLERWWEGWERWELEINN